MAIKKAIKILFLLFTTLPVFGQGVFVRHWTKKDGLSHNYTFLLKEHKGKLWIGTDNGISVFDGKSFKNYTHKNGLKSPYVIGFNDNYSDSLYLFTWRGGVHVYDETADSIKTYPYLQKKAAKKLHRALKINDEIYAWQWSGGFYFNEKKRISENLNFYVKDTTLHVSNKPIPIHYHSQNKNTFVPMGFSRYQNKMLVFGNSSHGIREIDGINLKGSFFNKILGDKIISAFVKTKDGGALVGSIGKIYKVNPKGEIEYTLDVEDDFYVVMMYELSNGKIAASISPNLNIKKCIIIDPKNGNTTDLEKLLQTKSSPAALFVDSKSRIWLSTQGDGIYMIENIDLNYIDINDIPSPHIYTINQLDSSTIIFSTTNKSYTIDTKNNTISNKYDFPLKSIYISNDDSLNIFSTYNKSFTTKNDSLPVRWGKYVGRNKGGIWFIVEDSLKILKENDLGNYQLKKVYWKFPKGKIEVSRLSNTILDGNNVWVATKGALSLYEFSGNYKLTLIKKWGEILKKWEWINDIKINHNSGLLWIATSGGLYVLDLKVDIANANLKKIRSLKETNCLNLKFDHLDQLWVGTANGLLVFQNGIFKRKYDESSGLLSDQITSIFESEENKLWIGTHRGIVRLNNTKLVETIPPPLVNWNSKIFLSHSREGTINLPINIAALSEMESLRLQYKLSKNSDWIDFSYKDALTINNQSPGKYKLFIRGKTTGSEWSIPSQMELVVEGYFWEYPIFKGGVLILIIISVIYYSNILIKKERVKSDKLKETLKQKTAAQNKLTRVRKEIAQDFHDEMGNKLASITVLADLASMKIKGKDTDTEKILSRIETQSKLLYNGTRDFIWSIDAQNDEIGVIYDYIKDFGEEFFDDLEIRYHTHKEMNNNEKLILPQSWSLQLVFIFKEAMTNIAKYAHATHVYLSLIIANNTITFSIKDNGIGILQNKNIKNGNGLKNMQARINKLGGSATLNIESQEGKGTTIIVQFNIDFNS